MTRLFDDTTMRAIEFALVEAKIGLEHRKPVRIGTGIRELVENGIEKLPGRLASEGQRHNFLRLLILRHEIDEPVRQAIGLPRSRRGENHLVGHERLPEWKFLSHLLRMKV